MIIDVNTVFGKTIAKPMALVDIHDVQSMTDEESINNSDGEAQNPLATAASDPAQDEDFTTETDIGEQ